MSAVTKLFVVLLVICSLLLVAAEVVFVNRVEDYKKQSSDQTSKNQLLVANLEIVRGDRDAARAEIQNRISERDAMKSALDDKLAGSDSQIKGLNGQIAGLNSQMGVKDAEIVSLNETIKSAQKAQENQATEIATLRDDRNKIQQQNGDLNIQITKVTKINDQQLSEINNLQELLTAEKDRNKALAVQVTQRGGGAGAPVLPAGTSVPAGGGSNAAPINGIIREVTVVSDVPYAMISVGSSDHVQKGMKFSVVDQSGTFMGVVTITTVQPNEAFGRLTGPPDKIDGIKPNMRVTTNL